MEEPVKYQIDNKQTLNSETYTQTATQILCSLIEAYASSDAILPSNTAYAITACDLTDELLKEIGRRIE